LRESLKQAQDELAVAENDLKTQRAEVKRLERRIQLRIGRLLEQLARLDDDLDMYHEKIQRYRSPDPEALESGYLPVDEQYRRVWDVPEKGTTASEPEPFNSTDKKQFKRLYRRLARRYHPDLARDQSEREIRNEQMVALNEAYEAGSLVELVALANESDQKGKGATDAGGADSEMILALDKELTKVRRRILLIHNELENLHNLPTVQLSLEVKFARRSGRDLLAEMAADLRHEIRRKTAERDLLKAQFEQLSR
jgi:hypothetical protein